MNMETFVNLKYPIAFKTRKYGIGGIHQMFLDLGYDSFKNINDTMILRELEKLDKQFDLIMLAERMDESLILLKNLMCWTIEDVAYVSINFRKESKLSSMSNDTISKLKKLNKPDELLYSYFKKVFEKKVENFGIEKMKNETKMLQRISENLKKHVLVEKYMRERKKISDGKY